MGFLDAPGIPKTLADARYQFLPPARIAFIGDSITGFGLGFPRGTSTPEPSWFLWLGGISYNMPTGSSLIEFRAADNHVRWTAPGDSAGPWTALRAGHNWLDSGTAGVNNRLCIGVKYDFLPTTDASYSMTVTTSNRAQFSTSFWNNAQTFMGQRLKIVGRWGIGGDRTRHMLARIDQVFSGIDELGQPAELPGYVCILGGTNDTGADSMLAADFVQNYADMVDYVLRRGAIPILCTIPARGSPLVSQQTETYNANTYIRNLAASDSRIILADFYAVSVDPGNSDGRVLTNYMSDGVHPSNLGGFILGKELARVILPKIGGLVGRATYRWNGEPLNKQPNGTLTGTGGTSSHPPAGAPTQQVADGYTAQRSGGTTLTVSATKEAVTGESAWQVLTCAGASSGDTMQFARTSHPGPVSLSLAAGDTIYAEAEFEVSNAIALRHVGLTIQLYDGTFGMNISAFTAQSSGTSNFSLPTSSAYSGVFRTPTVVIPSATTVSQIRNLLQAAFNSGGEAVIKIRNINLIKVES